LLPNTLIIKTRKTKTMTILTLMKEERVKIKGKNSLRRKRKISIPKRTTNDFPKVI
jgi:hypothetical protein